MYHFAACLVYVEVTVGHTPWREHLCISKAVKQLQIIGTVFYISLSYSHSLHSAGSYIHKLK